MFVILLSYLAFGGTGSSSPTALPVLSSITGHVI
jgi:hypothetical protein